MPNNRWQVKIQQCKVINSKTGRTIYTDMKKNTQHIYCMVTFV